MQIMKKGTDMEQEFNNLSLNPNEGKKKTFVWKDSLFE